ncbi:MAG: tRNA 2-thiocytidine(32) synthetase TtcA [Burkholderiaceae bacterium]|nr:tRNA 2-thiocytidine(32) synthetase TtcA [Burkholderiaceae bacterium]
MHLVWELRFGEQKMTDEVNQKEERERLSFENRKLEKRLVRRCAEAITDFNMLQDGDKVMVCVSGGKDSYALLDALVRLQGRAPIDFTILAVCIDQHLPGFPKERLIKHFETLKVPYHIEDQDTFKIVQSKYQDPRNYCSLCSRLRRGILYRLARELKCTKIALGHHLDDVVSTLMLNMFYGGRLKSMPPKLLSDAKEHIIIRPLVYMREKDLTRWSKAMKYDLIPKLCGAHDLCRQEMKEIIARMDRETPGRVENIFRSLMRVAPSHLLDSQCYDFSRLEEERVEAQEDSKN